MGAGFSFFWLLGGGGTKPKRVGGSKLDTVTKTKSKKRHTKKSIIEGIIISSSDSSSSEESTEEGDRGSSIGDGDFHSKARRGNSQWQARRDNCEVVTPPVFKVGGKLTLRDFLSMFEQYFFRRFRGSQYDQTQKFEKFLEGDLLEVFLARGGRNLRVSYIGN